MVDDIEVIEAMKKRGGSFVRHLGLAAACADPVNLAKIKFTWPKYWQEYTEFAEQELSKQQHSEGD